jgi:hypothetical protein
MELELREYNRKTFSVRAVEVTFQNVDELAKWSKGKVDSEQTRVLGGADIDLPVLKLQGQGEDRGKELVARLGNFIVESKGRFRVYKAPQFWAAFEEKWTESTNPEMVALNDELKKETWDASSTDDEVHEEPWVAEKFIPLSPGQA